MKFHENSSGSRVVPFGRTDGERERDMTKLIATFRNFANAPNKADIAMQCHDLQLLM